ncbi:peptidase inhibitor family I36 protein [Streptomyces sp. NPDC101062]|uniref:peptidase inhibitor family I36 protein n=1 Tax=unclassified Streptomyces TaxID=2593676 RepID=UPI00381FF73E
MIARKPRTRLGLGLAVLALAGTTLTSTAYAAGGQTADNSTKGAAGCPKGYFCVWPKTNYGGAMQKVADDNPDLTIFGGAFAKRVHSVFNNGASCDVRVYSGKNYKSSSPVTYKKGTKFSTSKGGVIHSNRWVNCK